MFLFIQAANKKVGSVKSGASKKGDGLGPSKAPKAIEPEDVEVIVIFWPLLLYST